MDGLVCGSCETTYPMDDPRWRCRCGGLLGIRFTARFDPEKIVRRKPTMWRYREALPIGDDADIVSFDEGMTPLIPVDLGRGGLLLKLEQLFTTGSYKDRGAAVLVSKAKELGIGRIVEDSSGNAGCAIAAYAAKARNPVRNPGAREHIAREAGPDPFLWSGADPGSGEPCRHGEKRPCRGGNDLLREPFLEPVLLPGDEDLRVRGLGADGVSGPPIRSCCPRGTGRC